jgi:hypothetical protein
MRWSYLDLQQTPVAVVDAVVEWMQEVADERRREATEAQRRAEQARMRR